MGSGGRGGRGEGERGEFVFLSFIGGGAPPVGCFQETREWGVGSREWGKRGNGGVCSIHNG
ncbi:MAG: hypothetical protein DSM106950_22135 [Stigonema ocellatum SAG 48.90 = DSM 106950]|nr:hypothetical protein [Stigonema ocellatum SAG 48.90 = DSM 106950]